MYDAVIVDYLSRGQKGYRMVCFGIPRYTLRLMGKTARPLVSIVWTSRTEITPGRARG